MVPTVDTLLKTALKHAESTRAAREGRHQAAAAEQARRDAQPPPGPGQGGGPPR